MSLFYNKIRGCGTISVISYTYRTIYNRYSYKFSNIVDHFVKAIYF